MSDGTFTDGNSEVAAPNVDGTGRGREPVRTRLAGASDASVELHRHFEAVGSGHDVTDAGSVAHILAGVDLAGVVPPTDAEGTVEARLEAIMEQLLNHGLVVDIPALRPSLHLFSAAAQSVEGNQQACLDALLAACKPYSVSAGEPQAGRPC